MQPTLAHGRLRFVASFALATAMAAGCSSVTSTREREATIVDSGAQAAGNDGGGIQGLRDADVEASPAADGSNETGRVSDSGADDGGAILDAAGSDVALNDAASEASLDDGEAPDAADASAIEACAPLSMKVACGTSNCGTVTNGCGGSYDCGSCPTSSWTCVSNCCYAPPALYCGNQDCGTRIDSCNGATIDCGTCGGILTCGGGGTPNQCGCTPTTCTALGHNCGNYPNDCGGTLPCGICSGSDRCASGTCGAGCQADPGYNSVCISNGLPAYAFSCTPGYTPACAELNPNPPFPEWCCPSPESTCTPSCTGKSCGDDGCGGSCGPCTAPQTCGGGGTAGQCGCTPATDCADVCGSMPDGCGGTLNCDPTCPGYYYSCGAVYPNQCGTPCSISSSCEAVGGEGVYIYCPASFTVPASKGCSGGPVSATDAYWCCPS